MITKKTIFILCTLISMLPSMAIAQTAAQEADDPSFSAPTLGGEPTNTSGSVTLLISVVSDANNRFLGDVKISFQRYPQTSEYTPDLVQNPVRIPDPPTPGGFKIENVKIRQYELIAERKGYKIYNEVLNVSSDKRFAEITIKMTPIVGTPTVTESDLAGYSNSTGNYLASHYSSNPNQYPYSTNNPYNPINNGGIYNPYNNYPNNGQNQYYQAGDQYGGQYGQNDYPYSQNGVGPYGNGQYPYQQGYNVNANESFIVPVVVNINQSSSYNINELNVEIVDLGYAGNTNSPYYSTMSDKITLTPQTGSSANSLNGSFYQLQSLHGCLQANRTYQVTVTQGYNYSTYQVSTAQPSAMKFISPSINEAVRINVYPPSGYAGIVQIRTENIPQGALVNFPIRCPNAGYNQTGTNGPTTFSDPQIYFNNLSNYIIQRMPQNGWYYLTNKNNPQDFRHLKFVDRGDGKGGLVFFSSVQTPYNQDPPSNTQWYFTGYTRNSNDDIKFLPEVFTKTPMTPDQYHKIVNQEVRDTFDSLPSQSGESN